MIDHGGNAEKINSKDRQLIDLILINNTKENDSANPLSDDDTRYL